MSARGAGDDQANPVEPKAAAPVRGPVVWKRTWVQDRPAQYGVVGEGLPVVFAHGWALGQHSYKAILHRLADQGCRVVAPALPGFGGTPGLPRDKFHLAGYAAWLEEFIREVGIEEKVVIVGHSFGGGVAIRAAYSFPNLVRSLVLVNSIGGSSWRRGKVLTSIADRPLWDWGLHFPSDVWPIRQATRVLPVILEDALPNLLRSPGSVVRVANMARRADLRPELEELKRRGSPGDGHLGQPGRDHPEGVVRGHVHGRGDGRHRRRGQPLVAAGRPRPLRGGHHQRPRGGQGGPGHGDRDRGRR